MLTLLSLNRDLAYFVSYSVGLYMAFKLLELLKNYFQSKRRFPQPAATYSFFKGNFKEFSEDPEGSLLKWATTYPDICSIRFFNKRIILLNSYEQMLNFFCGKNGTIVSNRPGSYFTKLISRGYKGILFGHYGKDLEVLRQVVTQFFKDIGKNVWEDEVISKFNVLTKDLKHRIEVNCKDESNTKPNFIVDDLKEDYERLMVDLVGPVLFGKSVDFEKLRGTILEGVLFNLRNTTMFNIITMLPIWRFVPNSLFNKLLNNTRAMHAFTRALVNEYKKEWEEHVKNNDNLDNYKPNDLINSMLYARYKDKTGETLKNDDDIIVSVSTIFLSFFESVSTILAWLTFYLSKNPQYQEKCRKEIEQLLGQSEPNLLDKKKFNYVNACIKETLRRANIVPMVLHVASESIQIDGYNIPKGTPVIANLYSIHMNDKIFDKPFEFDPNRWLTNDKRLEKYLLAFSTGKRFCIGKHLVKDMLFIFTIILVRCFNLNVSDEIKASNEKDLRIFGLSRTLKPIPTKIDLA